MLSDSFPPSLLAVGSYCTIAPMSDRLQGELHRLKQRESELKQQLTEQRRQLKTIQERKVSALRNQMRRVQSRLNTRERKRDTRWKILIGGTVLARAAKDPAAAERLNRMMDEALSENRDRQLLERWRGLRRATAQPGPRHKKGPRSLHEHGPDRRVKS